jgi:putative spermidine/putrescine transport system ATP-binding protein
LNSNNPENLWRHPGRQGFQHDYREGRIHLLSRAVGLWQDHDTAHGCRLRDPDLGRHHHQWRAPEQPEDQPAQYRHGVPGLCTVPQHDGGENVAFGLKVKGKSKEESAKTVAEMLALVGLEHLADRYPFQLSGGQQQRVALARALAIKPQVLLLDEPLSALDAKIRVSLREEIRAIQRKMGITTIFVTHDQEEALSISDRIVVMYQGRADQIGTPFEIYNRPKTKFVATFVGTLSIIEATVADPSANAVTIGGRMITIPESLGSAKAGDKINLALRPEALSLNHAGNREFSLTGKVESVSFLGSVIRTKLLVDGQPLSFDMFNDPAIKPPVVGDTIEASFSGSDLLIVRD